MPSRALFISLLLAFLSCLVPQVLGDDASPDRAAQGQYIVLHDKPAQVIWGLGFEIQCDSIGSANKGLPDSVIAVPSNLVPDERARMDHDMLKGFRYCRLALGLYLRGLDADQKHIIERYPHQMDDLREMQAESGIEGFDAEYWSPSPAFKSNGNFIGGTLKSFAPDALAEFAGAAVADLTYLQNHGLHVVQWGMQNEPAVGLKHSIYSTCNYSPQQYLQAFDVVAPAIRTAFPSILIHACSWDGQNGNYGKLLRADPTAMRFVDAWTWHRVGSSSNEQIDKATLFTSNACGKPVFNNEFEYLDGRTSDDRFVNTAQSIMNWMTFENAPTWYWLHALKPTSNAEAKGYALGFWRPGEDDDLHHFPNIQKNHWDYNPQNFNAIAGFLTHMPWNSRRLNVSEDVVRKNNRIMAFQTPAGKLVVVVTNRTTSPFTFHIDTGVDAAFTGYLYTPTELETQVGELPGKIISPLLGGQSVEFWVQK